MAGHKPRIRLDITMHKCQHTVPTIIYAHMTHGAKTIVYAHTTHGANNYLCTHDTRCQPTIIYSHIQRGYMQDHGHDMITRENRICR